MTVIKGLSGTEIEKLKKNVVKTIKDCELNITVKVNLHTVNNLDLTFGNPPVYINNCSNHPSTVIKQLKKLISKAII